MQDLLTWRLLGADELDVEALTPRLPELAQIPVSRRAAWLGRIARCLEHPDARLRAAALRGLRGARGPLALRRVVDALHDGDAGVRAAAAEHLVALAREEPARLAHLVFHPDPDIRRRALEIEDAPEAAFVRAHLLADPECADALLAQGLAPSESNLDLIVALHAARRIGGDEARRWVSEVPVANQITWARRAPARTEAQRREIFASRGARRPGRDRLDALFALFAEGPDAAPERARFFRGWADHLAKSLIDLALDVGASVVAAANAVRYRPEMVGLVACHAPTILGWPEVPRAMRRAAVDEILRVRMRRIAPDDLLDALLVGDVASDAGGVDLVTVAALMLFRRGAERYAWVVDRLGLAAVTTAFLRDPVRMAPFLSIEDRTARGREWMLGQLRAKDPRQEPTLVAIAALIGMKSALLPAQTWSEDRRLEVVLAALELEARPGLRLSDDRAKELAHALVPRLSAGVEPIEAWLTRHDEPPSRLGPELLRRLGRALDTEAMVAQLGALSTKALRRLLDVLDREALLSLGQERALAEALSSHASPAVTAWASTRRPDPVAPKLPRGGFAVDDAIAPLPTGLAEQVRDAADLADGTIQRCLRGRYRGLVRALRARRAPPTPSTWVAAAILGSHDPIEDVAEELERWIDHDDPAFLRSVDERVVTELGGRTKTPLHARCWLYRFERHGLSAGYELANADGGLGASLALASELACTELVVRVFATAARAYGVWWRREPARLSRLSHLDGALDAAIEQLDKDGGVYAAVLYRTMAESRLVTSAVRARSKALRAKIADCADEVRWELRELVDSRGLPPRSRGARAGRGSASRSLLAMIRESSDLDALVMHARAPQLVVVHEAVLRLVTLGEQGRRRLVDLLTEEPPPLRFAAIAASLPLWEDGEALEAVRRWLATGGGVPELRLRVALGLLEGGDASAESIALDAACAPTERGRGEAPWLRRADAELLLAHSGDVGAACRALTLSPHPAGYQIALEWLLSQDPSAPGDLDAARAFLELGTSRQLALRARVAEWLEARGDDAGLPLRAGLALEKDALGPSSGWLLSVRPPVAEELVGGGLYVGAKSVELSLVDEVLGLSREEREPLLERILTDARDAGTRSQVVRALPRRPRRARKLRRLAEIFAWGLTISRELAGRALRPHMISGDELGFTRLNENRVFITPLPLLRGERGGDEIVEGLILHEIGHHRHHRGAEEAAIWSRADEVGLGALLNLVADEHLERNLRAYDRVYGDKLKRLGAYAFQHAPRQIAVERLLASLGAEAFDVLTRCRLGAGVQPHTVEVETGAVLQELERRGSSFARFMRALRMGLGNRHADPQVEEALALFTKRFRKSSMGRLWEITQALHDIFGDAVVMATCFGGAESIEGDPHGLATHGEGIGDEELQGEVERVLGPPDRSQTGRRDRARGGRPTINVGADESFDPIEEVVRVAMDRESHRAVAREVSRHARRLRGHLERLGLNHVPRRMRLSGHRLDTTRIRALVTRRDPRVLMARETRITSDLFLGLVVDCSGSMAGQSMQRAHAFGVLLTEAARGLPNVDLRVFGFDDRRIFDAGDARRPAVTSLRAGAGNNDAAGLWHAAQVAMRSPRRARVLVMISDGLPTECSVAALRGLVHQLTRRHGIVCAQVAVRPLAEVCFPHYVEVNEDNLDAAVSRFGRIVSTLVTRTLRG